MTATQFVPAPVKNTVSRADVDKLDALRATARDDSAADISLDEDALQGAGKGLHAKEGLAANLEKRKPAFKGR